MWALLLSTLAVLDYLNLVDLHCNWYILDVEVWHLPHSHTAQASTSSGFVCVFAHTHMGHSSGEYVCSRDAVQHYDENTL